MKRVLCLTCALVLAFSALAWGDVDIHVSGGGTGEITIHEWLYTDFGEIHESFYADGDYNFNKDVYVWEDWLTGSGGIVEFKYFNVNGFVAFDEAVFVYSTPGDPDWFEMGTFVGVYGEGFVEFDKFVYVSSPGYGADLEQDIFIQGYLDGYVYVDHFGYSDSYWYIEQDYEFNVWTPTVVDHVNQTAFIWDGDSNWFGVGVGLYWEPFQITSYIYDFAW